MSSHLHDLTEEQRQIQSVAREFAEREIAPFIAQWDEEAYFEPSLVKKMGELGFLGMLLPEEYEGLGVETSTYLLALEEIAVIDASAAVLMSVHNSLPTQMILRFGSTHQRDRFLRPMARGELLGAFALSEPESGSDAASLITQAVRDRDDWILTGTKSWVTSGSYADVIIARREKVRAGLARSSLRPISPDSTSARRKTSWDSDLRQRCSSTSME